LIISKAFHLPAKADNTSFENRSVHALDVRCSFHTTPEKFENAALLLRLGLPSTLIRLENGAFRKRSPNRKNLKQPALRFRAKGKHFGNGTS